LRNSDSGLRILGKPKTPKPAGGALFRLCRSKFKGPGAGRSQARCFRDETCLVIPKRCRATAVQRNLYRLFSVILGCSRLFSGSPPAPLRRGIFFGRIIHRTKRTYRTEGVPPSSAFFRLLPGGGGRRNCGLGISDCGIQRQGTRGRLVPLRHGIFLREADMGRNRTHRTDGPPGGGTPNLKQDISAFRLSLPLPQIWTI